MDKYELNNSVEADLDRAITWQYDNAARLIACIGLLKDFAGQSTTDYWNEWKDNVVDIDTADDFGLSIWGKILNCPRPTLSKGPLSIRVYRRILKARFRLLNSNGSMDAYSRYISEAFDGNVEVVDGLDMSLTFTPKNENTLTNEELELIEDFKDIAFVYPSGVKDNFECNDPVIGFDGQEDDNDIDIETLDNGTFHWDARNTDASGKKNINRASVTGINPSYIVTGSQIRPTVTVVLDGETLVEDTDYIVQYGANVNKGTGYVAILGTGDYTGSITKQFSIVGIDISGATVTGIGGNYERGARPVPTVILNGVTLTEDTDYTCSYVETDESNFGNLTITGIGRYEGRIYRNWAIEIRSLSFVVNEGESASVMSFRDTADNTKKSVANMYISYDMGITWTAWNTATQEITINPGSEIRVKRNDTTSFHTSTSSDVNGMHFVFTNPVHCFGDVVSLVNYEKNVDYEMQYLFARLFDSAKIIEAPDISVSNITTLTFYKMFANCNLLTNTPKLKFIAEHDLVRGAFWDMFSGCTLITEAYIDVNFKVSVGDSTSIFQEMFMGCSLLNKVVLKIVNLPINTTNDFTNWLKNVSAHGEVITYTNDAGSGMELSYTDDGDGDPSGIPSGWVHKFVIDHTDDCLTFKSHDGNPFTIQWKPIQYIHAPIGFENRGLFYSKDGGNTWLKYYYAYIQEEGVSTVDLDHLTPITIAGDGSIKFIGFHDDGSLNSHMADTERYVQFDISSGLADASGNVMSLLDPNLKIDFVGDHGFYALFSPYSSPSSGSRSRLNTAPKLPCKNLSPYCYANMFAGTMMEIAPQLPATEMKEYCYQSMFYYSDELIDPPELPSTSLSEGCYSHMFDSCEKLQRTPVLPAQSVSKNGYTSMFQYCTSLKFIGDISAKELGEQAMYEMFVICTELEKTPTIIITSIGTASLDRSFYFCEKLKEVRVSVPSWTSGLVHWLKGVSANGVFYKNPSLDIPSTRGPSTIPTNWTVRDL